MSAVPLCHDIGPPLRAVMDQSSMDDICHGEVSKADYDFMEMDSKCCGNDCNDVKPATFVTGPEPWPAHLQLKVRKKASYYLHRGFEPGIHAFLLGSF